MFRGGRCNIHIWAWIYLLIILLSHRCSQHFNPSPTHTSAKHSQRGGGEKNLTEQRRVYMRRSCVCVCVCKPEYIQIKVREDKRNTSAILLPAHLRTHIRTVLCVYVTQGHVCIHWYMWACEARAAADHAASARWHFPSSGCSPDIFLVSDQSWFSQMSHSLRYTSPNEASASAFVKTQTSMKKKKKKTIFPLTKQSHHWGAQWF